MQKFHLEPETWKKDAKMLKHFSQRRLKIKTAG